MPAMWHIQNNYKNAKRYGALLPLSEEVYLLLFLCIYSGADLEEMVTDFRNNKRRRRKVLGGTGARFPGNFFFRVIHKNLTDFRKTVETGMDPRLILIDRYTR